MDLDKQLKAVFDGTFVSVASNCDKYAKSHSKKLADKLKETSPKLKKPKKGRAPGKYAKGWESKRLHSTLMHLRTECVTRRTISSHICLKMAMHISTKTE